MTTMQVCNYIVAILTFIIGGAIAWTSYGYGIEMTVFGRGPDFGRLSWRWGLFW